VRQIGVAMNELPLNQVSGIIGSGPLLLVTTSDGVRRDVMTLAWHTMHDFSPPLVGIVMGADHFSRELLDKSGSCVLAVPGADLATLAVKVGTVSGRDMDKFAAFDIRTAPAADVSAPLLADCLVNLECRVVDTIPKYEHVILRSGPCLGEPRPQGRAHPAPQGWGTFPRQRRGAGPRRPVPEEVTRPDASCPSPMRYFIVTCAKQALPPP
jgi:flavin reductase (DIM6/NTAB) family NADH-FMN oxidoreductase RutF